MLKQLQDILGFIYIDVLSLHVPPIHLSILVFTVALEILG